MAARADTKTPIDTAFRLKNAEAIDVDALFALLPEALRPTYGAAEFDDAIGAMVLTDVKVAPAFDADLGDYDLSLSGKGFEIGRAELYGVDQDALARVAETKNLESDDRYEAPFEDIFEKVRLFEVRRLSNTDNSATGETEDDAPAIGAIEFDKLAMRRGAFEGVNADAGENANAAHFFNAFTLAGLYVKDAALNMSDDEGAASDSVDAGSVRITAPDLRFVGLGGGKLDQFLTNNLSYTIEQSPDARNAAAEALGGDIFSGPLGNLAIPTSQAYDFGSIDWRSIDLSGVIPYALQGIAPPTSARQVMDLGSVQVEDAKSYVNGKLFSSTPDARVSAMTFTWLAPSRIVASTPKSTYDFTAYLTEDDKDALATFKEYGLDNVVSASNFAYNWDADRGDASLRSDFQSEGFSALDFSLGLAGLSLDKVDSSKPNALFNDGALASMDLTIDDEKMLDAIFAVAALQTGGAPGDLRKSAGAVMRVGGMQFMLSNPKFVEYINAAAAFVEEGGRLNVTAAPKTPVPFSAFQGVDMLETPKLLNITVERSE